MLVLSRKRSERILIGSSIRITVVELEGNQVRLGIEAPVLAADPPERARSTTAPPPSRRSASASRAIRAIITD